MAKDPTQLPSLSGTLEHDQNTLSDLERKALSRDDSVATYFEAGMQDMYVDQQRLTSAISAWQSFESFA